MPARYRKVARDIWLGRSRVAMMVAAIAVSLTTVGTVLSAGAILGRETPRNYLETNPASATLETTGLTPAILAAVKRLPNVADAAARATVTARIQIDGRWRPLLLFVADPADPMTVARFIVERGAWPPATGMLLLERSGLDMLGVGVGSSIGVRIGAGPVQSLTVSGVVHDASLAPAWQEKTGYGYATPATIAAIGGSPALNELRLTVTTGGADAEAINATAQSVATWLDAAGHPVSEIRIPPPLQHPHQWQLTVVLLMLLGFGVAALAIASILVAALVAAMLAEQVRQIGVLKAVGAGTRQVVALYVALPLVVGVLATLVAIVPTIALGQGLAAMVASLLNLDLADTAVPPYVFALEATAGILLPVFASLVPIVRAARTTVRQAIDDYGVRPEDGRTARLEGLLGRVRGLGRPTLVALRNTVRRPSRTALTLAMLALGGAVFLTGLNTMDAWNATLDRGLATRHYDLELRLEAGQPVATLRDVIGPVPGVADVQAWGAGATAVARPGETDVVHTYPDKGHGSFTLVGLPPTSGLVDFPVLDGRWLAAGDAQGIVLNQTALASLPGTAVGDSVTLRTGGRTADWRVVGVVQELGAPAMAYVTDAAYAAGVNPIGNANLVRLVIAPGQDRNTVLNRVEAAMATAGIPVAMSLTTADLRGAIDQHVLVLIAVLLATALLIAAVGLIGVAATMSISVVERTREIGILHAIGASPATVRRMVVTEGLVIGLASVLPAIVLSVPITALVGTVIGTMSFRVPLLLTLSPGAAVIWIVAVGLGSLVASAVPAGNASRMPVREALAYA